MHTHTDAYKNQAKIQTMNLLARDAFVRTNRRAIATMFVRLSVGLSGKGVQCDHTVIIRCTLDNFMV